MMWINMQCETYELPPVPVNTPDTLYVHASIAFMYTKIVKILHPLGTGPKRG